jgi:hypothetical protein
LPTVRRAPAEQRRCSTRRRPLLLSAFQARFPRDHTDIIGSSHEYTRISDYGQRATFNFCPERGATVYYLTASEPELVGVPVGASADPSFPPPSFSVWEERKHAWVTMPSDVECHP